MLKQDDTTEVVKELQALSAMLDFAKRSADGIGSTALANAIENAKLIAVQELRKSRRMG